jgi:hypothetical protein
MKQIVFLFTLSCLSVRANAQIHLFDESLTKHIAGMIENSIFSYIRYTDSTLVFTEEDKAAGIGIKEKLFGQQIHPYHKIPIRFTPDPYHPNFYLADVLDWVLIQNGDTIPIPLPANFNAKEKRYLIYIKSWIHKSDFGNRVKFEYSQLSGQFEVDGFMGLEYLSPLEKLSKRLVRFGVNNQVYPRDAFYQGIATFEKDSTFWAWVEERHCHGMPDCGDRLFIMKVAPRSYKIVLLEDEKGIDGDFLNLKIIDYQERGEFLPSNETPVPGGPPPIPKVSPYLEEIVVSVTASPRSHKDVDIIRNHFPPSDLPQKMKGFDLNHFNNAPGWFNLFLH